MLDENEKMKVTVKNEAGEDIECEILFTFDSDEIHKRYVVYTDNTTDTDGNINVYASTYDSTDSVRNLHPIKMEKEWNYVETILEQIQEEIGNNRKESVLEDNATGHWIVQMEDLVDSVNGDQDSILSQCIFEIGQKLLINDMPEYTEELFDLLEKVQEKLSHE